MEEEDPGDQGMVFRKGMHPPEDASPPPITPFSIAMDVLLLALIAYVVLAGILKII